MISMKMLCSWTTHSVQTITGKLKSVRPRLELNRGCNTTRWIKLLALSTTRKINLSKRNLPSTRLATEEETEVSRIRLLPRLRWDLVATCPKPPQTPQISRTCRVGPFLSVDDQVNLKSLTEIKLTTQDRASAASRLARIKQARSAPSAHRDVAILIERAPLRI